MKTKSIIEPIRKEQIINTTIATIAEKGYPNTSLNEIAKKAEISKGVINYYFSSKELLINHVIEKIAIDLNEAVVNAMSKEENASGKITAYVRSSFQYMLSNREHFIAHVDLWGSLITQERKKEYSDVACKPFYRVLNQILQEGITSGEFKNIDVLPMAHMIQGSIDGIMLQWVFHDNSEEFIGAGENIIKMIECYLFNS